MRTLSAILVLLAACSSAWAGDADSLAGSVLAKAQLRAGVCALPRAGDGQLALAIARSSDMVVYASDPRPEKVALARRAADAAGFLGRRVCVEPSVPGMLPFATDYVDLVLVADADDAFLAAMPAKEVARALCPNGKVMISGAAKPALERWAKEGSLDGAAVVDEGGVAWLLWTKPLPAGIDDWSHWFHGPNNNPVSNDAVLKWPYATQWLALPFQGPQPVTTLAAGGRTFTFMGSGYYAQFSNWWEDPADWLRTLVARNGYNGQVLWRRRLPDNFMVHRSGGIATGDVFYLIDGGGVLCLDPATGKELKKINFEGTAGEAKWIALSDGKLFALLGEKDPPMSVAARSYYTEIADKDTTRELLWGHGNQLVAYELAGNRTLWVHKEPGSIDSRNVGISGDRLFFHAPGSRVACLDATSGKPVWSNNSTELIAMFDEMLPDHFGVLQIQRTNTGMRCTSEAVTLHRQGRANFVALSATDGEVLWQKKLRPRQPYGQVHQMVIDGMLYTNLDWMAPVYDLSTGVPKGFARAEGIVCGRVTASPDAIYSQGGRGYDRVSKKSVPASGAKSGCHDAAVPGNGMLYLSPHTCTCSVALRGFVTYAPAGGDFPFDAKATDAERLETAAGAPPAPIEVTDLDWPAVRANVRHTGASKTPVATAAAALWEYKPAVACVLTAPVSAGGRVFLAGDDGKVRCLDGATGKLAWEFTTGARVMAAPTVAEGRVYVGSGDGFIYCLEAASGRMLWRFRASPMPRRIMVYGYLVDTWAVNSGVLVHDGVAYAASGINCIDGTYVYALDAKTGRIRWQNNDSGHREQAGHTGVAAGGVMTVANGKLWMPGGRFQCVAAYDLATGTFDPAAGCSDRLRGREIGLLGERHMVLSGPTLFRGPNERRTLTGAALAFLGLDPRDPLITTTPHFAGQTVLPAWDDGLMVSSTARQLVVWDTPKLLELLDKAARDAPPKAAGANRPAATVGTGAAAPSAAWTAKEAPLWGIALAKNAIVTLQGIPSPRGIGALGWQVVALDRRDGHVLWEFKLPSEPLVDGLCIDRHGSVVVALLSGGVIAAGKR